MYDTLWLDYILHVIYTYTTCIKTSDYIMEMYQASNFCFCYRWCQDSRFPLASMLSSCPSSAAFSNDAAAFPRTKSFCASNVEFKTSHHWRPRKIMKHLSPRSTQKIHEVWWFKGTWSFFCIATSNRPSSAAASIWAETRCRSTSISLVRLSTRSKRPSWHDGNEPQE